MTVEGQTHASNIVYNAASQTTQLKVGPSATNQITENYGYNAQTGLLDQTVIRGASTTLLNLGYDYAGANGKRTGQLRRSPIIWITPETAATSTTRWDD